MLALLTIRRSQQPPYRPLPNSSLPRVSLHVIRWTGIFAATLTIALPVVTTQTIPLVQCGIRIVCFFYACKLLDLCLAKAETPPVRLKGETNDAANMDTPQDFAAYTWLLFTEMRYHSFDIAAVQKRRQPAEARQQSVIAETMEAIPLVAAFAFMLPIPERACLLLLLFLQISFECLHSLLHPHCPRPLFDRPFYASSMGSFWTTHWHACAAPFLHSLAYRLAKRIAGKWFGVLTAFALSGVWHGWASGALVDDEKANLLSLQVWALFVMMGLICLAEG